MGNRRGCQQRALFTVQELRQQLRGRMRAERFLLDGGQLLEERHPVIHRVIVRDDRIRRIVDLRHACFVVEVPRHVHRRLVAVYSALANDFFGVGSHHTLRYRLLTACQYPRTANGSIKELPKTSPWSTEVIPN